MRNRAKVREALSVLQNGKVTQPLANVQEHAPTISRSLPEYPFQFLPGTDSGFQVFCRRLLDSTPGSVQPRQQRVDIPVAETLAHFKHIFQTLESEMANKLPNGYIKP